MGYVVRDEEKLYYYQLGDTSSPYTMVFVHGATMTGEGLRPLASALDQYNCIVVDLPGHGKSVGDTQHSVEDFTDRIQYLIEQLVVEKVATDHVIMMGYSMGGCISLELAFRKVSAVKRVIILSSGADMKGNLPLIDPLHDIPFEEFNVADVFKALFGRNTKEQDRERIIEHYMTTRTEDKICYTDLIAAGRYDRLDGLKDVSIPTLAICGDEDIVVTVGRALAIRDQVKDSALCIVPYCGHGLYMEEPELVVTAINDFIAHTNLG